ncbi:UDP-N-acetylmuramoyl-L-alanyl-D-glutamate--2,6-diaminopimelate ligase [Sporanaerobium hydrogeniformans]|uniref:UDP-N-acetylmuramoyl-L-alanyl-D-glutamate--2, 6-diaminopimelate ligase n=1 Tax=Sporanaerobium hydrogeniformans TaxID=3072179 RepID=A0AC61DD91_9FIRM|nr:UDP-N-acetylmuramoyl-L-alanyl-D-glutamate--2,6-diaminopimelate ligase [Sporanaerobium hydrogeniformans]PHV71088.1 UDP-N-acetylmuramoyl-L-alanyl-D-glutamate--2,6-diaminopimelate ligase [Sporanaerobium hydrogeniformans]
MKLKDLMVGLEYNCTIGNMEQDIDMIIYDSRIKTKSGLFIAIEGFKTDGHQYIQAAIENGAKALLVQKDIGVEIKGMTVIQVEDTRKAMAIVANNAFKHPSSKIQVVGVTGTNGKTSITYLLGQVLEAYKQKIGIIGTIENRIGNTILKAERTTPESLDLQGLFNKMVDEEVDYALLEVSSHALELSRVAGVDFNIGIFTNLTQDHLDFHGTMENYAYAKAKLFSMCEVGVINADSPYAHIMTEKATCELITYGIYNEATYKASDIHITAEGVRYTLCAPEGVFEVVVPIPGQFTVYNTLAVIGAASSLQVPMPHIIDTLAQVKGVPGRVQSFTSAKGYSVLVDYAHTPDGLQNVLETIKEFAKGEIITVFGCGGDRDKTKRPLMGEIAARYSTHVIITSDNPRTEDPLSILDQVEKGVKQHKVSYSKMVDRKAAILEALQQAKAKDVILIAGKGHENYQILKDRIIHFDDSEIVREYIQGEE